MLGPNRRPPVLGVRAQLQKQIDEINLIRVKLEECIAIDAESCTYPEQAVHPLPERLGDLSYKGFCWSVVDPVIINNNQHLIDELGNLADILKLNCCFSDSGYVPAITFIFIWNSESSTFELEEQLLTSVKLEEKLIKSNVAEILSDTTNNSATKTFLNDLVDLLLIEYQAHPALFSYLQISTGLFRDHGEIIRLNPYEIKAELLVGHTTVVASSLTGDWLAQQIKDGKLECAVFKGYNNEGESNLLPPLTAVASSTNLSDDNPLKFIISSSRYLPRSQTVGLTTMPTEHGGLRRDNYTPVSAPLRELPSRLNLSLISLILSDSEINSTIYREIENVVEQNTKDNRRRISPLIGVQYLRSSDYSLNRELTSLSGIELQEVALALLDTNKILPIINKEIIYRSERQTLPPETYYKILNHPNLKSTFLNDSSKSLISSLVTQLIKNPELLAKVAKTTDLEVLPKNLSEFIDTLSCEDSKKFLKARCKNLNRSVSPITPSNEPQELVEDKSPKHWSLILQLFEETGHIQNYFFQCKGQRVVLHCNLHNNSAVVESDPVALSTSAEAIAIADVINSFVKANRLSPWILEKYHGILSQSDLNTVEVREVALKPYLETEAQEKFQNILDFYRLGATIYVIDNKRMTSFSFMRLCGSAYVTKFNDEHQLNSNKLSCIDLSATDLIVPIQQAGYPIGLCSIDNESMENAVNHVSSYTIRTDSYYFLDEENFGYQIIFYNSKKRETLYAVGYGDSVASATAKAVSCILADIEIDHSSFRSEESYSRFISFTDGNGNYLDPVQAFTVYLSDNKPEVYDARPISSDLPRLYRSTCTINDEYGNETTTSAFGSSKAQSEKAALYNMLVKLGLVVEDEFIVLIRNSVDEESRFNALIPDENIWRKIEKPKK
jgi:hypothetical protein